MFQTRLNMVQGVVKYLKVIEGIPTRLEVFPGSLRMFKMYWGSEGFEVSYRCCKMFIVSQGDQRWRERFQYSLKCLNLVQGVSEMSQDVQRCLEYVSISHHKGNQCCLNDWRCFWRCLESCKCFKVSEVFFFFLKSSRSLRMFTGVQRRLKVLQNVSRWFNMFKGVPKMSQDVSSCCKMLQDV